ncbi:hypothetical protein FOA52_012156 [Chlamydomonas sp. UWO 241]|nr:hypothetical protein FOA52_012156 [Chlamydomonas sp. UWO 241]
MRRLATCSAQPCIGDSSTSDRSPQLWLHPVVAACARSLGGACLLVLATALTTVRPASAATGRHAAADAPATVHNGWRDTGVRLAAASPVVLGSDAANAQLLSTRGGAAAAPTADSTPSPAVSADTAARLEELYGRHAQGHGSVDAQLEVFTRPLQTRDEGADAEGGGGAAGARTEDVWADMYSSEVGGENDAAPSLRARPGDLLPSHQRSTSPSSSSGSPIPYADFLALVADGRVARVAFGQPGSGPCGQDTLLALVDDGGGMGRTVLVSAGPSDPGLLDLLSSCGVVVDDGSSEGARLAFVFSAQFRTYLLPFLFLSAAYWAWHTGVIQPMPNAFRRKEFLRYRREQLVVASKLNFRSPMREVRIDTAAPDFIEWDDINGIDAVKKEIVEVIEYLKNPGLLRQKGVSRIGGVLLAGAPGTGKTLLAKSIAAESGVKMFTCSGTDFFDVYTGVGARRVRETFERMRAAAPAILFVDEFDALGAARGAAAAGDESTSIINELLVQMDGFEDNAGIVVLGATNRPGAIDSALIRPGRFDRIIYMPLPDAKGRAQILQVHARDKFVAAGINWMEVARSMAGFTGADCMGLMQRATRMAARQGRESIHEDDLYAAMEDKAVEAYIESTGSPKPGQDAGVPDPLPQRLRRSVAVYEAGKALLAHITPEFEEIARISICPGDVIMGYTLFLEDEEKSMDSVVTRSDLEAHMVMNLGGACAEKLVMGQEGVTSLGAADTFQANVIAREMILSMGMGAIMGPVDLMHTTAASADSGVMTRTVDDTAPPDGYDFHATDMSTEQARIGMAEIISLLEAGEAKAYYGLATNWRPLLALADALESRGSLKGREVVAVLEAAGCVHFTDPYIKGYGWDAADGGRLTYPLKERSLVGAGVRSGSSSSGSGDDVAGQEPAPVLTGVRAKTWYAGTALDAPRNPDGTFKYGWHWGMPYTLKRNIDPTSFPPS